MPSAPSNPNLHLGRTLGARTLMNFIFCVKLDRYTNFAPNLNGRYLSSNVNITVLNSDGEVVNVPVGGE